MYDDDFPAVASQEEDTAADLPASDDVLEDLGSLDFMPPWDEEIDLLIPQREWTRAWQP